MNEMNCTYIMTGIFCCVVMIMLFWGMLQIRKQFIGDKE